MSESSVLLERRGGLARITLNRPGVGNAIDLPLARELLAAAIVCDQDPAIRCVVLSGAGRMFCAGGDVALFGASADELPGVLSELAGVLHLAESRLARMAKPLVVAVNGPAAGAGFSLSLFGDVVLASHHASFTAAYGALGLSPDGGLSWLLPRLIGLRRAQEVIITGCRVTAEEAETWGLVTRTVDPDALEAAVGAVVDRLLAASAPAMGAARGLLLGSFASSLESHLEREARAISGLSGGSEAREGIDAFINKRPADFNATARGLSD